MSLTSYRAAPPRAKCVRLVRAPALCERGRRVRGPDWCRVEGMPVWTGWLAMGRSGGDRLSRVLRHSTMGAGVFNGRVRDGIGFWARRSGHQTGASQGFSDWAVAGCCDGGRPLRQACSGSAAGLFVSCVTGLASLAAAEPVRTRITRAIKPIGRLVPVGSTRRRACTPGLSTWSSSTALKGGLVLRGVSRLDAFSGYPVRT